MMEMGQKMPPSHGAETPQPSCEECAWWEGATTAKETSPMFDRGWCRRYAPRPKLADDDDDHPKRYAADWPVTSASDYCGDAKPRWP